MAKSKTKEEPKTLFVPPLGKSHEPEMPSISLDDPPNIILGVDNDVKNVEEIIVLEASGVNKCLYVPILNQSSNIYS